MSRRLGFHREDSILYRFGGQVLLAFALWWLTFPLFLLVGLVMGWAWTLTMWPLCLVGALLVGRSAKP